MPHRMDARLACMGLIGLLACKGEPASSQARAEPAATPATQPASTTESPLEAVPAETPPAETPPAETPPSETAPLDPAQIEPIAELPTAPPRFWVAHANGMQAYDLDGTKVGSLPVEGEHVRRLADGRFVAYQEQPEHDRLVTFAADGKRLRSITLPSSFDTDDCSLVMPAPPTPPSPAGTGTGSETGDDDHDDSDWGIGPLRPQDAYAFGLDAGAEHACLILQDRNDNMADMGMLLAVDLQRGKLRYRVTTDINERCGDKGDLAGKLCDQREDGEPWIESTRPAPSAQTWAYEFDGEQHTMRKGKQAPVLVCAEGVDPDNAWGSCGELESRSPSGRWVLLSGHVWDGDYIHRELALFDRSDGKIWQVTEHDDKLGFITVTPADMFDGVEGGILSVVGESEIEWLPDDRLWIDGRLLIPERHTSVQVGGTLVRTR